MVAAVGAPLLAVVAGGLPNPASAGGGDALGSPPRLLGSYCAGSERNLPSGDDGCARITGYIAAGEHFGPDGRIGGRAEPFAPLGEPGIAGARSSSGLTIIGAPLGGDRFLLPADPRQIAR